MFFGATKDEHNMCLSAFLRAVRGSGLKLNKAKSFGKSEIQYFGHVIGVGGMKPDQEKVKAIMQNVISHKC